MMGCSLALPHPSLGAPSEGCGNARLSGMLVHQGLKAQDFKVAELKYWLSCRGAPTKGRKQT